MWNISAMSLDHFFLPGNLLSPGKLLSPLSLGFQMIIYTDIIEGIYRNSNNTVERDCDCRTCWHIIIDIVLTAGNSLQKDCKITTGNNSTWRDLYLSCSDIYFSWGTSTNILSQRQTHIQRQEFHISGLNKVIHLLYVRPELCYSSKVWVTWNCMRQGSILYSSEHDREIAICPFRTALNVHIQT